jgi:hypothetical protein
MQRFTVKSATLFAVCALAAVPAGLAQQASVTAQIEVAQLKQVKHPAAPPSSADVVWLEPLDEPVSHVPLRIAPQIVQHNKAFEPHLLVVPVGTVVQFPNKDPYFHNVFSLFDGKRFDLGLYEAGSSKPVHFDKVGVSFLFCNIHPEMSAVVVAVDTPYYSTSDKSGRVQLANIPDGRYELHVWSERSSADNLRKLTKVVTISASARDLGSIRVPENPNVTLAHKNKYGQDYVPVSTTGYSHN